MSLYLCIFDKDNEVDGVEVGRYEDFNEFRKYIARELEGGRYGSRFPTLMMHSDCDGQWVVQECELLRDELSAIRAELESKSPLAEISGWQIEVLKSLGLIPKNAFESFIDVDGEPLVERLQHLVGVSLRIGLPIIFQ